MKRKILLLTGLAISLFLLFIAAGAGIFTGSSENTQETENNLVAQTTQPLMRELQFGMNYPYFEYENLRENTDNPGFKVYTNIAKVMENSRRPGSNSGMEFIKPREGMLSPQTAANIGGEVSKRLCFFLKSEQYKPMIILMGKEDKAFYMYSLSDGEYTVQIYINAVTGQLQKIERNPYFNIRPDRSIKDSLEIEVSADVLTQLIKFVNIDSHSMFYSKTPEIVDYKGMAMGGYYSYTVKAKFSEDKIYDFTYITTDNDTFQLHRYSVAH